MYVYIHSLFIISVYAPGKVRIDQMCTFECNISDCQMHKWKKGKSFVQFKMYILEKGFLGLS